MILNLKDVGVKVETLMRYLSQISRPEDILQLDLSNNGLKEIDIENLLPILINFRNLQKLIILDMKVKFKTVEKIVHTLSLHRNKDLLILIDHDEE